jgi:hypothetical protein
MTMIVRRKVFRGQRTRVWRLHKKPTFQRSSSEPYQNCPHAIFFGDSPLPHRKSPPEPDKNDDNGADTAEERQKRRWHFRKGYIGEFQGGKSAPEKQGR